MQFKILNRSTENKIDPLLEKALVTIDLEQKAVYLNRPACEKIGVWIGDYVDFLELGKNYHIAKSGAPNGYKLGKGQIGRSGEYITTRFVSAPATRVLQAHLNLKTNRQSFYLLATAHEYKENPVFELLPVRN
jgi:hypothetical protein